MTYIFDFDGTLVDSMPTYAKKMLRLLDENHLPYPDDIIRTVTPLGDRGAARLFIGMGMKKSEDELLARMNELAYDGYAHEIPAKPNVPETLRRLKADGHSLNVLTASPHTLLDVCLKRLGLFDLFDHVWSCDDFGTTKTDPSIYVEAAKRIGAPLSECVFLDDNLSADTAAKASGIKVIGVYDASSAECEDAIRKVCDGYIRDFTELIMSTSLTARLLENRDEGYRDFHGKLIPTVPYERIIGVRLPVVRRMAKEAAGSAEAEAFLHALPHTYYDENNLHAFLIEREKSFEKAISLTEAFLPYIDNWATCDSFLPPVFKKNHDALLPHITVWLGAAHTYTIRYGIGLLMGLYLDEHFDMSLPRMVADVRSEEYYVNMMRAWYFATALDKQYDAVLPYLTENRLDIWTHNKTISKARESRRIPKDVKDYLNTLKR